MAAATQMLREACEAGCRAVASGLRASVLVWSLLPLAVTGLLAGVSGFLFWEDALDAVADSLASWGLVSPALAWLDAAGGQGLRLMIVPLIVVALAVPVLMVLSLLAVAWLIGPRLVDVVARTHFPTLERRGGVSSWQRMRRAFGATLVALIATGVSLPLWLIAPWGIVVVPLICGGLNAHVLAFDALAAHASEHERTTVLRDHRAALWVIGTVPALAGAGVALMWTLDATWLVFAPVLIVVSVWLYNLACIGSMLWFAHFTLKTLDAVRGATGNAAATERVGAAPRPMDLRSLLSRPNTTQGEP